MKKFKLFALIATLLCAMMVCSVFASACGEEPVDYSTYTYSQFKGITYEQWNKKTISYQFHTGTTDGNRMDVGFGAAGCYTQVILNLYSDGTAAYFQAGIYNTGASNQVWYDKDNHISWGSFGLWEEVEGTLNIYLLGYFSDADLVITKDASFADNDGCSLVKIGTVGGVYTYSSESIDESSSILMRYGINDNGEGMGIDQAMTAKTGSDIEFKTIESWIDTYISDNMGQC